MNITTDNYETYLLDYMEGNLNTDKANQLKAFVADQGMDWNELTAPLPYLDAPQVTYESKERLKKKATVVSLYVKIASAAAAAGLLLTIGLWPEKQLPKLEPIAELKPIEANLTVAEAPIRIIPRKSIQFTECQYAKKESKRMAERAAVECLTMLSPLKPQKALALVNDGFSMEPDLNLIRYRMEAEHTFTHLEKETAFEEDMPTSWIAKGIYRMTEGRHNSIGSLINAGLHIAKKEVVKTSTDIALTAYNRADEHFEEAKERWEEKHKE